MKEKFLTIIPARGGSKRIPHKNLRAIAHKPLLLWTIEAAVGCDKLERIMVNTDSEDIATLSKNLKIDVPFIRDAELSSDHASMVDVVMDTIEYFKIKGNNFEYLVLLQPTSPLRRSEHIYEAIELLENNNADCVVSVSECQVSPSWCNTLPKDYSMNDFFDSKYLNVRSQDLPQYYHVNGAIFICSIERFMNEKTFYLKNNSYAYVMDEYSSIDIDKEFDLFLAEKILELKHT